ncbi:MAG: YkvA family protein, partial [Ignavibacteriaceae bacterium]
MNNEEVDFAELGDLGELGVDELDFGGNIGNRKESAEEVDKKIKFVEENLWEKLERVGKKISFARDILALVNYMRDPLVSWHRKAIVVAGLIYFISPIDAIPDISPLIGYMDDLGVITALLKFLGSELTPYYQPGY